MTISMKSNTSYLPDPFGIGPGSSIKSLDSVIGYDADGNGGQMPVKSMVAKHSTAPIRDLGGTPVASPAPTTSFTKSRHAAAASVASGGSGYVVGEVLTLTGGTFVAATQLTVSAVSGGAITAVTIRTLGSYSVDPTNPVSVGSTTGSGTGATFNLTMSAGDPSTIPNVVNYNLFGSPPYYIEDWVEPITNIGGTGYAGGAARLGEEQEIEFCSDSGIVELHFLDYNSTINILVDGALADATKLTTPSTGFPALLYVLNNGSKAIRNYRVLGTNMGLRAIHVEAGCQVWEPTERREPFMYVIGDSLTFSTGANNGPIRSWAHVMEYALGLHVVGLGVGSTGWNTVSPNTPADRVASMLLRSNVPDYVMFALGFNDAGGNMTTLAASAEAAIAAVQAGAPNAKILVLGPWTPGGETTNLQTVKTTLSGVCSSVGVDFVDISTVFTAANKSLYVGGDNIHPNGDAGHEYLGGRVAQLVAPYL